MESILKTFISGLENGERPDRETLERIIGWEDEGGGLLLNAAADRVRQSVYGKRVFARGLVEITNFCKRNCKYCGIRGKNGNADRYRLSKKEILDCCSIGHEMGYRTFVLQGGEDPYFSDEIMVDIIGSIKRAHPDSAVTLSIGEKSKDSYQAFFDAGADRYLLRHETASSKLYDEVHEDMHLESRLECLENLKSIGFQIGAGFMVGLPGQSDENLADDLLLLADLQPHMVGIGPFIPHPDTPFRGFQRGGLKKTIKMLALARLMVPKALIPATTALGTIDEYGREKGLAAGANVVMPNISPSDAKCKYSLYADKIKADDEPSKDREHVRGRIEAAGYELDLARGDHIEWGRVE